MKQNDVQPIVIIIGTRPEGIKMIPVYKALQKAQLPTLLCSTMQHDQLLTQVFKIFNITPDFSLDIMRQGQNLFYLTQSILQKTKEVFLKIKPSLVLVQGDTTSTMASALSAFYLGVPVGHVEAGLRTDDVYQPFPEEANRRMTSIIAKYHFAPTSHAAAQLLAEGIDKKNVFCTGNTIVDSLRIIQEQMRTNKTQIDTTIKKHIDKLIHQKKKIVILTTHRRESFNGGIENILSSVKNFLLKHNNVFCFYPYHPNPFVIQTIQKTNLAQLQNIFLCEPLNYIDMVYLLINANLIATDSGGIQEESISLGKPVLILREKTERSEGIWSGLATIVGTDKEKIFNTLKTYINSEQKKSQNIYGDGYSADKIAEIIKSKYPTHTINQLITKTAPTSKITDFPPINTYKNTAQLISYTKESSMKKICVFGLGYIGLPTAIVLAESGFKVIGFDINKTKVKSINAGDPIIQEPEIFEKLQIVLATNKFNAKNKCEKSDYFIIAVPTPFNNDKTADLSYIYQACKSIAKVLEKNNLVILESTVPVGTTKKIAKFLEKQTNLTAEKDFFVAHCPERVLPGRILHEIIENDRIIGGISEHSTKQAACLYSCFVKGKIHTTNADTAEIVKLIENSSRDIQIAFAHQIASMTYACGLNPYEVIELANKHPRVNILQPSCGVGGHCIAIDPWFLIESFPHNSELLKSARKINDKRPFEIIKIIEQTALYWQNKNRKTPTVLLLGLTYKPDVDDLRESPAIIISKALINKETMNILVSEPQVKQQKIVSLFKQETTSVTEGLQKADIVVFLVNHKRFKAIDKKLLSDKLILDFCGINHIPNNENIKQDTDYTNEIRNLFIPNANRYYEKIKKRGVDT